MAKTKKSKKKENKNEAVLAFLDKFKPDTRVYLRGTFGRKSIVEEGYGHGSWQGHVYSFKYSTVWRFGTLESNDYDVEDLMNILKDKWIDELTRDDLGFQLQNTTDGDTDIEVTWEEDDDEFTEDELVNRPTSMDCYWDGEISDSEYNFNGIEELLIRIDCLFGHEIDYTLNDTDKAVQLEREKTREKELKKEQQRMKRAKARKLAAKLAKAKKKNKSKSLRS